MAEKFFEDFLTENLPPDSNVNRWLLGKFEKASATCSIEEFAQFFLSLVKSQTDEFIKSNTSTCNTPRKSIVGVSESDASTQAVVKEDPVKLTTNDNKATRRQSSRELFGTANPAQTDSPVFFNRKSGTIESSTPVNSFKKLNQSFDVTPTNSSTPRTAKNSFSIDQSPATFRNSRNSLDLSSRNASVNKRNSSSPFCLGDFINTSTTSSSGKGGKKKNNSQTHEQAPNFSNNDFPSLGEEVKVAQPKKVEKPVKRVVPITVSRKSSSGTSSFISSSFQGENNLLNIDEGVDIMSERKMLSNFTTKDFTRETTPKRNLHAIVKENLAQSPSGGIRVATTFQYDEAKVEKKEVLELMSALYSFLLDLNLVSNILSEFSYLFNLLNTEIDPFEQLMHQTQPQNLLKNLHNCIYFTASVLNRQKLNLALLDSMTIRVLIDNERVQLIAVELYEHMLLMLQKKSQLDAYTAKQLSKASGSSNVVFFQQETDNRDNFPSDREFGAFKNQRDLFYTILRSWELKHLDPLWDFKKELGGKIRTLVTHMEHPINMAHLARLFTAQLIISCNFDNSTNELQSVLPNIDLSKLSKLRQRLVAPSVFSTQYLFPGNQAFFKDFILCCDQHLIFMEQLKISLINELMQINDSSMETLCICDGDEDNKENILNQEFIVRAEAMTTMRVLAKFIGFVMSRPYSYEGYRNTLVDQKQSQIRNLLHPNFDVKSVVTRAINGRKLLVTIPWLVEYLAMLDFITIRLDYYRELFQLLHSIYVGVNFQGTLCSLPTSKFIIRACLGWLFENPVIPEEYYEYRGVKLLPADSKNDDKSTSDLNPHLESILNAACPFLADFRVSVMPQRTTKTVSRTGRYRHITTKFQDKTVVQQTRVQDNRERLIEAFLSSQTISTRRIVDFTIDRVTSAVVKDFQVKNLIPIRKEAKTETEKLNAASVEGLVKLMVEVYLNHLQRLQNEWNEVVEENCKTRIKGAFNALLPTETLQDVKSTLMNITFDRTTEKLQEWRATNISTIEIFSKDIQADATKIKENSQQNDNKRSTNSIVIDVVAMVMPSDFFKDLQLLLHKGSLHPDQISSDEILNCFDLAEDVLNKQTLPLNAYRNIAFYALQLILLVILNRPDLINENLLSKVFTMWRHEKLKDYVNFTSSGQPNRLKVENFIFSKVVSARIILLMRGKSRAALETYGNFLVELVRRKFISAEQINEQSIQLYKHEWSNGSLNDIAYLMGHVKKNLPASPESQLFMELIGDLAKDMENF